MLFYSCMSTIGASSNRWDKGIEIKASDAPLVSTVFRKILIGLLLICGFYCSTVEANDVRLSGLTQRQANPVPVGTSIDYSLRISNVDDGFNDPARIGVGIRVSVDGTTIRADSGQLEVAGCSVDNNFPSDFACNDLGVGGSQTITIYWLNPTPGNHTVTFTASCQWLPVGAAPVYCSSFGTSLSTTTIVGLNPTAVLNPAGPVVTTMDTTPTVTFDGRSSTDQDGTIANCAFSLDGGQFIVSQTCSVGYNTPAPGNHSVELLVTDNHGLTDRTSLTLRVLSYPEAVAGPDQQLTDSDSNGTEDVTFDASSSSDVGGNIVSYEWFIFDISGAPIATGVTATAPIAVGTHTVTLRVTDDDGMVTEDQMTVTVQAAPNPPTANAGPDQEITDADNNNTEDVTLDGTGSSDSDGTIVSYQWFESGTEIASGVSPNVSLSVGTHNLTLRVTDNDGISAEDQVTITILAAPNTPPTANAGPDQQLTDSDNNTTEDVSLDGTGSSDSDGTIVRYQWLEAGTEIASGASPNVALSLGTHNLTLRVIDNDGAISEDQVTITILAGPNAPTANAGVDQQLTDSDNNNAEDVQLDGTDSSDADGTIVSYQWLEFGTEIASGASANVTLSVGTHTLTLRVTDNDGIIGEDLVIITILAGPNAPTANAGPDQQLTDSDNDNTEDVTLDGTASTDSDGTILSYEWLQQGTQIATGATPTVAMAVGMHTLTLRVTDNDSLFDEDQVVISIDTGPIALPVADAGQDLTLTDTDADGSEQVSLDGSSSFDSDGTILSYQWFENGTEIASGATVTIDLPVGIHTLILRVTDDDNFIAEDQLTVTIAAVSALPVADAGTDQTLVDVDGDGSASVTLDGTGSSDSNGTIISYTWYEGNTEIATGATPTIVLSAGVHILTLEVMDDSGLTHQDQVTISVNGDDTQLQIVSGSSMTGSAGDTIGPFTILLADPNGTPVADRSILWHLVPENAATLSESESITDQEGQASTTMTIQQTGVIKLIATLNSRNVEFVINSIAEAPGLTANQEAVGRSMDNLCPSLADKQSVTTLTAAEQDLLMTCNNLVTEPNAAATLSRLAPDEVAAQGTASIEAAGTQLANINTRLVALRSGDTGMNLSGLTVNYGGIAFNQRLFDGMLPKQKQARGGGAGDIDDLLGRWGGFINGSINFGDKDGTDRETGFDFDTSGVTFGLDYRFNRQFVAGGALGFSRYDSDYSDSAGNLEMDAWSLSAYGTYFKDDNVYVDGLIQISTNNYDTQRRINAFGAPDQFGQGDTDGMEYSFNLSAGYEYRRNALTLTPYGRLSYTRVDIDSYTEQATNPAAPGIGSVLHIEDQALKSMVLALGGNLSYNISTANAVFVPQLRFEWEHELKDDSRLINARFVHDPTSSMFALETDEADRDYFSLGLGMSAVFSQGRSGYIFYETRLDQDDVTLHRINAGVRIEF
ncbi:MAG: autotransporter domain-containing protein [Candidatus Thiodiazotropha sp.]